ncbi:signal peptide containing protein [Theileria equi strain WA]|uniref:Signal peptide containing protein n=1 Tax=Theileria equi strain WA TaxID=1537102 RepID=L1LES2_THEEQ|nr:signal peptide containing protein [Theileria equi strain WA]EKX73678.1 signal peptide containing protein [Theileria equi strain WA]|eukprot:XP_004833130.1 signal peptide containing protein [Theileria equi strain WA]
MKVLAALWAVSLVGLCHGGELGNLRKGVVDVPLDLSSPDPSLARDYKSIVDGVVYYSYFPKGQFFNKVVDGGVTLWEAEGEERCDVLFSNVGDRTRVILHVWPNSTESKMLYYENVGGEWKLVTIRVKGVPESEEPVSPKEHAAELDFATLGCPLGGCSGSEAKPKVTLPPTESNNNGEDASENKVEGGTPDDEEESGESQPKEVDKEEPDQQSNEYAAGPVADPQESGDIHYESSPSTAAEPSPTEDTEQTAVSSSDPVDQQPTEVNELQESEPLQSTESPQEVAYQQSEAPLEDPKPVSNEEEPTTEPKVSTSEKSNEVEDSEETLVEEVQPEVAPAESPEDDEPGNGSEKEFGDSESTGYESSDNNLPETKVEEPEEPTKPANSSLSKVDSTLFNVEEGEEDAVKVLKLKAKEGTSTNRLLYDSQTVWEDKKKLCSSAVLYLDGEKPTLAVLVTRDKNNKQGKVYRYHDGKQWKDGREGTHKTRLKKLKEKYEPEKTLDISKREDTDVGMYFNDANDESLHIFDPRSTRVTKVVDGENVIWQAGKNEKTCTWARLIVSEDKKDLILTIKSDREREVEFRKVDDKWERISETTD